eukprot:6197817-Pleurochrysis_carterae.AAC.1
MGWSSAKLKTQSRPKMTASPGLMKSETSASSGRMSTTAQARRARTRCGSGCCGSQTSGGRGRRRAGMTVRALTRAASDLAAGRGNVTYVGGRMGSKTAIALHAVRAEVSLGAEF